MNLQYINALKNINFSYQEKKLNFLTFHQPFYLS